MTKGFPQYGCTVKVSKTKVNFKIRAPWSAHNANNKGTAADSNEELEQFLPQVEGKDPWLRWCGLRLNTNTLNMMADYSRFITDPAASDGLGIGKIEIRLVCDLFATCCWWIALLFSTIAM